MLTCVYAFVQIPQCILCLLDAALDNRFFPFDFAFREPLRQVSERSRILLFKVEDDKPFHPGIKVSAFQNATIYGQSVSGRLTECAWTRSSNSSNEHTSANGDQTHKGCICIIYLGPLLVRRVILTDTYMTVSRGAQHGDKPDRAAQTYLHT